MKAVILGPTHPFRGGVAHHTTLLYRAFAARHTARLVTFVRQYPRWLYPGATDRDASAVPLAAPGAERLLDPLDPRTWGATARAIAAGAPDLLVVPWYLPYWAPSVGSVVRGVRQRAPGARVVFLCHNVVPHERMPWDAWLTRWALAPADAHVVHARAQAAALAALLPGARIVVHPHPLYDMFVAEAGTAPDPVSARAAFGLPAGAPVALFFGFVRRYKGLEDLIAALAIARTQVPDLHLLVVGEFWDDARRYTACAEALGVAAAVTMVDRYVPNEEVARCFAAADVAVLPYREATQSGVASLAYGFGLPVIATTAGGLPEVVQDGVTGLLVPPCEPAAMAQALVRYFRAGVRPALVAGVAAQRAALSWDGLVAVFESLV